MVNYRHRPLCVARYPGGMWFRVFGYGLRFVDHRVCPPVFSEREGLRRGWHVGPYCVMWLPR